MPIFLCSQLPTSRLISYGVFSGVFFCLALWRYRHYYPHGAILDKSVPTLERVMQDNCVVVAAFNMIFCLLISLVNRLQYFYFGPLVGLEPQFVREKLRQFALSRSVFLIGVINATKWSSLLGWTLWFSCLSCLYGFTRLARPRCEQLIARNDVLRKQWLRFGSMLVSLTCGTVALLSLGVKFRYYLSDVTPEVDIVGDPVALDHNDGTPSDIHQIIHVLVFMFSDSILVLALLLRVGLIIVVNALDGITRVRRMSSFDKIVWLYNINLTFDVLTLFLHFSNHAHMLIWTRMASLTSLIICVQVFIVYSCLARRLRRHFVYQSHVKAVRQEFPLERIDQELNTRDENEDKHRLPAPESCAICWEPLWTWRRLPCSHCFHETCLTMWIEQDPSCPTCRCRLLPQMHHQQRAQQPSVFGLVMHDFFNFFGGEDAGTPPQAAVENQHATWNLILRVRQRGVAPTPRPSFDLSVRITSGSGRRPTQHGTPPTNGENQINNEAVINVQHQQGQAIQSTIRSRFYRFDVSRYISWLPVLDIEFSETVQNVAPLQTNRPIAESSTAIIQRQQNQRQRASTTIISQFFPFRTTASNGVHRRRHLARSLSSNMRAQAEQISAAFPAVSLRAILADLAMTRVPEATVENILEGRLATSAVRASPEELSPDSDHVTQFYEEEHSTPMQLINRHTNSPSAGGLTPLTPMSPPLQEEQQQSSNPSFVMARRKQQMLSRARQHFLMLQQRRK